MTTEEYFTNLAGRLELTEEERNRISGKHNALREKLREKLPVEDDFLTGSYARNTIIRPSEDNKFDVDFFLAFSKEDYGESELPDLLKIVKEALDKIKNDDADVVEIKEQKRSIGVVYDDNFQIDVVPAVQIEKDKRYKIFDKNSLQAVESNPKLHGENLTAANESTASDSTKRLVPIIKILKSWRRQKCDYMKPFHLEMLTIEILRDEEIKSFAEGIFKFFLNSGSYLQKASLADPANEENIIDSYLDEDGTRASLLELTATEKGVSEKAIESERDGEDDKAVGEWKKIFDEDNDEPNEGSLPPASGGPIFVDRAPSKPWCNVQFIHK